MTIGERIKEVREHTNMSQVEFAEKINVSKQTLYKYENNLITNIPSDKIEAIAKFGNVSPAYLMGWEDLINEHRLKNNNDEMFEIDSEEIRKLNEAWSIFKSLRPEFQDYALEQIKKLSELQNKN